MSNDYTFISDLNNVGMQQMQMPPQEMSYPNNLDLLQKYLGDDDDSDDESDSEEYGDDSFNWMHVYGIVSIILLLVILFYTYKIRKELMSMYDEA